MPGITVEEELGYLHDQFVIMLIVPVGAYKQDVYFGHTFCWTLSSLSFLAYT